MSFILFIIFTILILFFLFPYLGARILKGLLNRIMRKDYFDEEPQKDSAGSGFGKASGKKRKKKIIGEDEGEYIDFEEFKDSKNE